MVTLVIDTSSHNCLLALFQEKMLIDEFVSPHGNDLSKILVPSIQTLLKKNHFTPSDLHRVGVGMGPGSYTGTRVGVAVARTLSFSLKIPLKGFCSLFAFLPIQLGPFSIGLLAKSGKIYLIEGFQLKDHIWVERREFIDQEVIKGNLPSLSLSPNLKALGFLLGQTEEILNETNELHYMN